MNVFEKDTWTSKQWVPKILEDTYFEHDKWQHFWGGLIFPSFILWFLVEVIDIFFDIRHDRINTPGFGFSWKDLVASFAGVAITKAIVGLIGCSVWPVMAVMLGACIVSACYSIGAKHEGDRTK